MAVTIKGQAKLHGLQHAEQNTILKFFHDFYSMGTITILGFAKTSAAAAAAVGITGAAITVYFNGPGASGKGGSEIFCVPGPEFGGGISFALAAAALGLVAFFRAKRSSAV